MIVVRNLRDKVRLAIVGSPRPSKNKSALPDEKLSKWHRRVLAAGLKGQC